MTFEEILRSTFLRGVTTLTPLDMAISLSASLLIGIFIFFVYRKTFAGVMYSHSYGISLITMSLVTTTIIFAVTSNVALSLGAVGALSIVRFRAAMKEPLDIAFLFWAISTGIITGAGLITYAVIGSFFTGMVLMILAHIKEYDPPYIVILNLENDAAEAACLENIKTMTKKSLVKAKTVSEVGIELTMEVRLRDGSAAFLNQLLTVPGVNNACLVNYNGDYTAF